MGRAPGAFARVRGAATVVAVMGTTPAVAVAASDEVPAEEVQATVRTGGEVDSNPRRLDGEGSPTDAAVRTTVAVTGSSRPFEGFTVDLSGRLGGRLYASTSQEDTRILEGRIEPSWRFGNGRLFASGSARDRTERGGLRDYFRGNWSGGVSWVGALGRSWWWTASGWGGWDHFDYKPSARFSYTGPSTGGSVGVQNAMVGMEVGGGASFRTVNEPRYEIRSEQLVEGEVAREDVGLDGRLSLTLTLGPSHHEVAWLVTDTSSNSWGRGFARQTGRATSAFDAGFEGMTWFVVASIQQTHFRDAVLRDLTSTLSDENRNRVGVAVEQRLWFAPSLAIEARYDLYLQAFRGDDARGYRRHLGYIGVVGRTSPADGEASDGF